MRTLIVYSCEDIVESNDDVAKVLRAHLTTPQCVQHADISLYFDEAFPESEGQVMSWGLPRPFGNSIMRRPVVVQTKHKPAKLREVFLQLCNTSQHVDIEHAVEYEADEHPESEAESEEEEASDESEQESFSASDYEEEEPYFDAPV